MSQNQLGRPAAPKKQRPTPFHTLPAEQQLIIERTRNLMNGVRGELGSIGFSLCSQVELANRLSDLVEDLDGNQHHLAQDLAHGLHSTLLLLNAGVERVTDRLYEAAQELPDFCGERLAAGRSERGEGGRDE